MFAYCLNNPVNLVDYDGKEPITISVSVVVLGVVVLVLVVDLGAQAISSFLNWLSTQWYYSFANLSFTSDNSATDETLPQGDSSPSVPEPPDVTYPGDDPEKAPDGYEWQGKGKQGSKEGSYFKPKSGESLHPDLDHPEGKAPHWDYNYRGSGVKGWRIFSDGTIELKK